MSESRSASSNRTLVLVVAALTTVVLLSGTAAADPDVSVEQGDACHELAPLGDGTQTVKQYYDYRASEEFSSHGTTGIQQHQVSQLYVYNGSGGMSLVLLHDQLGDGEEGGTISMDFSGLPSDGSWPVEDDAYSGRDDTFDHQGTESYIDWVWAPNRTDGAAFRGLESDEFDAITVDARFNDDADRQDWQYADDNVTAWQARSADGTTHQLDMSQGVTVSSGTCDSTAPTAALDADPSTANAGETVTFDASNSTDDGAIEEYRFDFDGDGSVDETTADPTTTHAYANEGSYTAEVTVVDAGGNTDSATTPVTVEGTAGIDSCTEISEPGRYELASDITDSEAETCIRITSSDVVLDGNGHTIDGVDGTGMGVYVNADSTLSNVTVRDLTVTNWRIGVEYRNTQGSTVDSVVATNGGLYGIRTVTSTNNEIVNSEARNNDDIGFAHLQADEITLRNDVVTGSQHGFHFEDDSQDITLVDSRAHDNGFDYHVHRYDSAARHDVRNLTLASATVSFTGGKHVALTGESDPAATPGDRADVDSYVRYDRGGTGPQLDSLTMRYDESSADGVDESTLRLWRDDGDSGSWSQVADPNSVDTGANQVTAESIDLGSETVIVFAPLGNESSGGGGDTTDPVAEADVPASATVGEQITVDASASSDDQGIESYDWSFGDGTAGSGETATHSYDESGTYTVTLTVTDGAGNTNTTEETVSVEANESDGGGDGDGGGDDGGSDDGGSDDGGNTGGDTGGSTGGSTGGTSGASAGASSTDATATETAEPVAAVTLSANDTYAIDLRNVSADERISTALPTLSVYEGTAVRMDRFAFRPTSDLEADTVELAFAREAPDGVAAAAPADTRLAYVDLEWQDGSHPAGRTSLQFTVSKRVFERYDTRPSELALYRQANGSWTRVNASVVEESDAVATYEASAAETGPLAVGLEHPSVELASVDVNRTAPSAGETVAVSATFENAGHADGTTTARLVRDGETVDSRTVAVPAQGSETVTFTHQVTDGGEIRLGVNGETQRLSVDASESSFRVVDVAVTEEAVAAGDEVTIRATVENAGDADGSYTAELGVDGTVVERRTVDVPAGERTTVTFTRVLEEPGTATVAVGDASTTVEVGSDTPDGTPTSGSGPGFGAVVAVAALLLGLGARAAARRD